MFLVHMRHLCRLLMLLLTTRLLCCRLFLLFNRHQSLGLSRPQVRHAYHTYTPTHTPGSVHILCQPAASTTHPHSTYSTRHSRQLALSSAIDHQWHHNTAVNITADNVQYKYECRDIVHNINARFYRN